MLAIEAGVDLCTIELLSITDKMCPFAIKMLCVNFRNVPSSRTDVSRCFHLNVRTRLRRRSVKSGDRRFLLGPSWSVLLCAIL